MQTFKGYFKKEMIEAIRSNKYLILFLGTVFWALLDPLLLKLLPVLLENTLSADLPALLPELTKDNAFQNFIGDFFEISTLFFAFTLMGIFTDEIRFKRLVFPYCSGAAPTSIVLAKYFHYFLTFSFFIFISFLTNYLYIDLLFDAGVLEISAVIRSSLLYILYYGFLLSLLLYLSSLFKRGILAGITVVVFAYSMNIFNSFQNINNYLPNYLILKAQDIVNMSDISLIPTIVISSAIAAIFIFLTSVRMKNIDLN